MTTALLLIRMASIVIAQVLTRVRVGAMRCETT